MVMDFTAFHILRYLLHKVTQNETGSFQNTYIGGKGLWANWLKIFLSVQNKIKWEGGWEATAM